MIPGYQIIESIHASKHSQVFRALRLQDNVNVILKLAVQEALTKKALKNLEDEYYYARQVQSDYVIKYFSLQEYSSNQWVFVQEDIEGSSLAQAIPTNGFEVETFLKIAIQMVLGLQAIHYQGIIHKDIKPSNIVVNFQSARLKIIDFGSAIKLRQENQSALGLSVEAGTLAYISPEQTGRINRTVDYRTDYYSLGVSFYELLSGQLEGVLKFIK